MKKGLLASSAVALAMAVTPASAAEWSMDVGGFYTGGIGLVNDNIEPDQPVKIINDGEIHFDPTITLDNGLKFGAHVELEAQTGTVDESDMFVTGSFGTVRIGANDGAYGKVGGPACPVFACTDNGLFDRTGVNSIDPNGSNSSDDIKISYFSPSLGGFSAAVSYIPSDDDEGGRLSGGTDANSFEVGAGYGGSFGDFSVDLGAAYYHNGNATEEANFGLSAAFGFSGFTLGGSYGSSNGGDDTAFGVGATYDTGPWNFGVYYGDELDTGGSSSDAFNAGFGASYDLADGVTIGGAIEYGENAAADDLLAGAAYIDLSF